MQFGSLKEEVSDDKLHYKEMKGRAQGAGREMGSFSLQQLVGLPQCISYGGITWPVYFHHDRTFFISRRCKGSRGAEI